MRRVNIENKEIIESVGIVVHNQEYKLNGWGNADLYYFQEDILVLIEIEKGQKHPNTNVIKVWPYLEENPDKKILLIQLIHPNNKAPKNRLALCRFFALRMQEEFAPRFRYIQVNLSEVTSASLKANIDRKIKELS